MRPRSCWEGVFTAPLHNKESYSIVACVFVAAVMCVRSRYVTMNVYSDFAIPAFGRHVTIYINFLTPLLT
jgi:DMSO reductase anchor subunit